LAAMIVRVHQPTKLELSEVAEAPDRLGSVLRSRERGQKQARQDRDDRDDNQQFNECERHSPTALIPSQADTGVSCHRTLWNKWLLISSFYGKRGDAVAKKIQGVDAASSAKHAQQVANLFVNLLRIRDGVRDFRAKYRPVTSSHSMHKRFDRILWQSQLAGGVRVAGGALLC
jgi:hypothetical protein